jgi:alkyl hydroperoxide reductase subunit AhpC
MTPAIQKPAPAFSGTAVIDGQFKEIKLSDYKGKYLVRRWRIFVEF